MKKFLLIFFLLSASVLPGSAAFPRGGFVPGDLTLDPPTRRPVASYYHVQLEPGFSINVYCYVSGRNSQIEVECNEPIYAMDVVNLSTGMGAVTRAHGDTRATVTVPDYHGHWLVEVGMSDGTWHTGEIFL